MWKGYKPCHRANASIFGAKKGNRYTKWGDCLIILAAL